MDASSNMDPVTAHSDSAVVHWLTNDTRDERFLDSIFAELCVRLQRADIPVKRASLHLLIYHPQWLGARIMWADGMYESEFARIDYDVRERSEYINSPANEIGDDAAEVCKNLARDPRWVASTLSTMICGGEPYRLCGVSAVPYTRQAAPR
jgi:adenylate cyclase